MPIPKVIKRTPEVVDFTTPKGIPKKHLPKLTPRQQIAVAAVGKGGSKADALRKAGYSKTVINSPAKVFDKEPVAEAVENILAVKKRLQQNILKRMEETLPTADFSELSNAEAKLAREVNLLEGNATDRVEVPLTDEEDKYLNSLIDRNTKRK